MANRSTNLRLLPSVDSLLRNERLSAWEDRLIRPVRTRIIQSILAECRKSGSPVAEIVALVEAAFEKILQGGMGKAINATGVVLHTNLGRAPVGRELLQRLATELPGYCSLEMDLEEGKRGDRLDFASEALRLLVGVESSLIVNNNAAALFLLLSAVAQGKKVLISRGELVQIGGGFRIPDILELSGAHLVEVGTTNITRLKDYEKQWDAKTALVLKVHHSNFSISGHAEAVEPGKLAEWAKRKKILCAMDLGSGSLLAEEERELSVEEVVRKGLPLVCFSGDKLLGGSQAGIVVGKKPIIEKLRQHPLYRALRLGKHELYLIEQTLKLALQGKRTVTDTLLGQNDSEIQKRAELLCEKLQGKGIASQVLAGTSSVGGGALPSEEMPTFLVQITAKDADGAYARLLSAKTPVIPRRIKRSLLFDLRTVFSDEESSLLQSLEEVRECLS